MKVTLDSRHLVICLIALAGAALLGLGRQPGLGSPGSPASRAEEHGVLTFVGPNATFLTSDAKARRWQEIIKASGQPVVEEYNRMSVLDTLVNGGWDIVAYDFEMDPTGQDVERYLMRRRR